MLPKLSQKFYANIHIVILKAIYLSSARFLWLDALVNDFFFFFFFFFWGTLFSRKLYLKNFNIKNKDNEISQGRGNSLRNVPEGISSSLRDFIVLFLILKFSWK